MASPPPNPDTRELPYGWMQQYNWEYRQWFYVNTREQPPRSSWEHPLGPMSQGFPAPPGPPPPDRSYNRSPYGGPQPQAYGGYTGYQPSYGPSPQGYYGAPAGGYAGGAPYATPGYPQPENRGFYGEDRVVYAEEDRKHQKKGPGLGTALLAGGAGLVGGALLMDAIGDHNEREREEGFDQGYQDGWDDNQVNNWDGDGGW